MMARVDQGVVLPSEVVFSTPSPKSHWMEWGPRCAPVRSPRTPFLARVRPGEKNRQRSRLQIRSARKFTSGRSAALSTRVADDVSIAAARTSMRVTVGKSCRNSDPVRTVGLILQNQDFFK